MLDLKFDAKGLIPAVIQDHKTKEVLMVGYMNQEAFEKTCEGPHVWFFSRSKNRLWKKGETSGHTQTVKEIRVDCDTDCLLILAEQNVAACHKGYHSCFYRTYENDSLQVNSKKIF